MSQQPLIKNTEYLQQRLTELGISEKQNTFTRVWSQADAAGKPKEYTRDYQIFDADEHGNIVIHYFDLNGQPYRWKKEDTKMTRDFNRLRLREPNGDMKYAQAAGSPLFPYFPPELIHKFKTAEEIGTLFLTEGEFKAFKACKTGIDTVGLPGIHGFYNGDIKGKLHEDIEELIIKCKVNKLVLLFDADLLSVKWAEDKDLSKRPLSFYGSIKSFRESLQPLLDNENIPLQYVYFMHIKQQYMNDAKGLDDLLVKYADKSVEIQQHIAELNFCRKYFDCRQINDLNKDVNGWTYKYLGLSDEQEFYKLYKDFIGPREFLFKRRRYIYDQEKQAITFVRHQDADKFMRIGPDWVKIIVKRNKFGEKEEEIVPWKVSELQRDYKKYPDFLEQIPKFDDFCNEPAWNGSYKRVIEGCFNLVEPLRWKPKDGSIAASIAFLKHLFQGIATVTLDDQGRLESENMIIGDQFTVALDYLTILFKHPKHMLPVPILVSQENGTGKSTFLKWLQMIFGSNMCILGNDQFKMKFNGHYITKFIIAIDEGFLEVDKKAEKERLKQLVTADSAYLENKGMNVRKINYYGKLIICSNDADRVMKIEDGESRWFVVKVPVIPKDKMDPDLEAKLKNEAEAFIHYLEHREIFHKRSHRLWFSPEHFITEQFRVIVETTKNRLDRVFEDWIREQFMLYRLPVLRYSMKHLTEVFNDPKTSKYRIDAIELKSYLQDRRGMLADVPQRVAVPVGYDMPDQGSLLAPKIMYTYSLQRPYTFKAEDWLTAEQLEQWKKPITTTEQLITTVTAAAGEDLPF